MMRMRLAPLRSIFDFVFRSRDTGRITIAQPPNFPLVVFFGLYGLSWLTGGATETGRAAGVGARFVLAVWAADELLRGVNPWRRGLGLSVLAWLAASSIR